MPYPVENLCNIKEYSRAHSFVFKGFFNYVGDTMHLVYCQVIFFSSQTDALALSVSLQ
jgi:hypothetical protein